MKISRLGASLAGLYLLASTVCVAIALSFTGDPKGRFVFLQLPIAVQGSLLGSVGLDPLLSSLDWVGAYVLIGGATAIALYLFGSAIGNLFDRGRI